jgi:hypothetical protein
MKSDTARRIPPSLTVKAAPQTPTGTTIDVMIGMETQEPWGQTWVCAAQTQVCAATPLYANAACFSSRVRIHRLSAESFLPEHDVMH